MHVDRITLDDGSTLIDDGVSRFHWEYLRRHYRVRPKVEGRIHVTTLAQPPYKVRLERDYAAEIVRKASGCISAVRGTRTHAILEGAMPEGWTSEVRMEAEIGGVTLVGTADAVSEKEGAVADHKEVSVWEILDGLKPEREAQLNVYAWLVLQTRDWHPTRLFASCEIRDHSKTKAERESNYPPLPSVEIEVPVWGPERTEAWILERIRLHTADSPPPCSDEERWCRKSPEKWAVMKKGGKRAVKLFDSGAEATAWLADQNDRSRLFVEHRPERVGPPVRCPHYCDVAGICPAYQESRNGER